MTELKFTVDPKVVSAFFPILQKGVMVNARVGCTLHHFLCHELGLDPEYVQNRIQTLFLDGKAVDDPETARIGQGAVISLSGAMPGLLGATLRKGGHYGAMRRHISYRESTSSLSEQEGVVMIKLFNVLIKEVGPAILSRGVYIEVADFGNLYAIMETQHRPGALALCVDGENMDLEKFKARELKGHRLFLKVNFK
ncbi:MAG: hypothetical protein JRJ85_08210 [Deltaproteobacteria bacterium]|nr:hypothetical protein [Deltaproteobacteria bacterium]